ncbi:MAG: alpha/beta fold hydrolase [Actinomycetota bacterium]
MLPPKTQIEIADRNIAVRRLGEGPPVLALHGFPQTSACWVPLADRLGSRFEFIMPDLPGLGDSDPVSSADMAKVGDHLIRLLDELGIQKIALVGHDFGGAVAWSLALRHPGRISKLVVVNSPFRKLDLKRGWHMLFFNLPILPELVFTLGGGRLVTRLIQLASSKRLEIETEAAEEYRRSLRTIERQRTAFDYYRTTTRAFMKSSVKKMLGRGDAGPRPHIGLPTMVVWGMKDPVLPGHLLNGMERYIDDLRIERLDGVGHFVPEEAPAELARALEDFLA